MTQIQILTSHKQQKFVELLILGLKLIYLIIVQMNLRKISKKEGRPMNKIKKDKRNSIKKSFKPIKSL
jgi:hypothetical protein